MAAFYHGIRKGLILVIAGLVISACGGGGSSAPADFEPEDFSFVALSDQEPGASLSSNVETISGINRSLSIIVEGGEYSIAGDAFTSGEGTIRNGQSLQLRATASSEYETSVTVTVTVGDNPAEDFIITTRAKNETPGSFSFTAAINQELLATANSNSVTITGIDPDVALSIENGSYSLDDGTSFFTPA